MNDPMNVYRGRYKEFIEEKLIERPLNEKFENSVCHHIIPKCCEGTWDDGWIYLSYREHFIAHKILAEDNPDNKGLIHAYWRMCNGNCTEATPEDYELGRILVRESMLGIKNPAKRLDVRGKISIANKGKLHPSRELSEETRKKISEALRGKTRSKESIEKQSKSMHGENNPAKRPEVRLKISNSLKGRELSESTKSKLSEIAKGRIRGPLSEETKSKISEANRGKKRSEEFKERMRDLNLGKTMSEDTKKKIGEANKSRIVTRVCVLCGSEFIAHSGSAKYCQRCKSQ